MRAMTMTPSTSPVRSSDTAVPLSGTRRGGRRPSTLRVAAGVAIVVLGLVWSTTSVSADDSPTTTTTTTLPPAPSDFAGTLVSTYQAEVATAQALGQTQGIESVPDYQQQIDALDPNALALAYAATQQVPEWSQIPSLMQTIAADAPSFVPANESSFRTLAPTTSPTVRGVRHAVLTAITSITTPSAVLVGDTDGTMPVAPFSPADCGTYPPDAAVFAAQLVIDISYGLYNAFNAVGAGEVAGFSVDFPAIVLAVIFAAVILVAQIVHDTLVYLQTGYDECLASNLGGQVANVDNTTLAIYALITSLATAVGNVQTTANLNQQDVVNIQSGLSSLQTTLQQSLQSDTQTLQTTVGTDTTVTVTELQTIQSALQTDLTSIENVETTTGQSVTSEIDKGTLTIQTAMAAALTQILNETDSDAKGLTTLITQGNQQILNALQSNSSSELTQYQENLRFLIEQGLAGWGPVLPEVKLILPASLGGLLNSTPVGVQELVTADLQSAQSLGLKIKPSAYTELSAANTALAAKQYVTAWNDYAQAYQALA
jgi:hypothetical protein